MIKYLYEILEKENDADVFNDDFYYALNCQWNIT